MEHTFFAINPCHVDPEGRRELMDATLDMDNKAYGLVSMTNTGFCIQMSEDNSWVESNSVKNILSIAKLKGNALVMIDYAYQKHEHLTDYYSKSGEANAY